MTFLNIVIHYSWLLIHLIYMKDIFLKWVCNLLWHKPHKYMQSLLVQGLCSFYLKSSMSFLWKSLIQISLSAGKSHCTENYAAVSAYQAMVCRMEMREWMVRLIEEDFSDRGYLPEKLLFGGWLFIISPIFHHQLSSSHG